MSANTLDQAIHYELGIKTLSPLYIGTQDTLELSPYSNFIVRDGRLHLIDEKVLVAAAQRAGELDYYVESIGEQFDNNRSNFDLGTFVDRILSHEANQSVTFEQLAPESQQVFGLTSDMRVPVAPTISSVGRAYLPGSSLKGALRTAILYHWLCSDAGRKELKQNFRHIQRLERTNRKKAALGRKDYHRRREIEREERRILRDIFREEDLFGRIVDSDARHIRVQDSEPIDQAQIAVYLAERQRLVPQNSRYQRRESNIPQPRQAIRPGTDISSGLSIVPAFRNQRALGYLAGNKKSLVDALNHFTEDALDNEIYQLRMALPEGGTYARRAERLIDFYEKLLDQVRTGEKLILRLGAGKTAYDNSLLLALIYGDDKEKEEEYYFRIMREAVFGTKEEKDLFPVTRTLTSAGDAFGWVEIEFNPSA